MQQHIDFPMEISVLKFQAWPSWPAFLDCFSKQSTHILVVTCIRLQFGPVGSGWQWISEGLNCVRFLFKFATWKIGPLSHLNDIFLSCFCYAFVRVCLLVPCSPLLGEGWPFGSRLWCLIVKVSLSNWYPGSGVGLIVSIPDLCPLSYFYVFPLDNIRKPFTLCITQSLNSQIYFHLLYWIALFCI